MRKAILICYSFESKKGKDYQRVKFFKSLYGWKQVIKKKKKYVYKREGLLDRIPHLKIDQSSFIVPEKFEEEILNFMKEWKDLVCFKKFKVLIDEELENLFKEIEKEFRVI